MTDFEVQAETLRSTAKNLRTVAQKYLDESNVHQQEADAIIEEAMKEAAPLLASAKALIAKANEQYELAFGYETAANVLMQR
jgi:hypothetical protein